MVVNTAIQEDVDAISLSILSGAHNHLFPRVIELLRERGAEEIVVFGGGIIPEEDMAGLKEAGVVAIFTPGASTEEIIEWVRQNVHPRRLD
jgi:methylmalonyl-CoA mutase C-terminal domain/subunit